MSLRGSETWGAKPLIDIGVNLMHKSFNPDREAVVENAAEAGVSPLIITGTGGESSREAADYAVKYPGKLYSTAGVHPHEAKTWGKAVLALIRETAGRKCVAAIGECGLDYNRDFSPREAQRRCFEAQIELAGELALPLFLHERDAFRDFAAILEARRRETLPAVVHCFTGTGEELEKYLDLECYIGITGWICDERRGNHLGDLVKRIPPDRLLLETDAPFLIPRDLGPRRERSGRSGRNEPKYLPHIAAVVARCLGKDPEQVAAETYANSRRFFGLAA
jgi:TatD DNase family protein